MFAQTAGCVDHGIIATTGDCCPGLTPWAYDANTGSSYAGFGCWNATCAQAGQWAGPNGVGNQCCTGLTNVNGKCGTAVPGGSVPPPVDTGDDTGGFFGIPTEYLIYGAIALVAMMMLGGKKR